MSFEVPADDYAKFMGRYSQPLAAALVGRLGIGPGQPVLDVGCGPGAVTAAVVAATGHSGIVAADPSAPFVRACHERFGVPAVVAVAATVWDYVGGGGPRSMFWRAAHDLDPAATGEAQRPGSGPGQLTEIASAAGLTRVVESSLAVEVDHAGFDDWWEPYTMGVGPAGAYVAALTEAQRIALRDHCRELLPMGSFTLSARAWTVVARVAT